MLTNDIDDIADQVAYRSQAAKRRVFSSALSIQNINSVLCQVDDQGNVTPLLGGVIGGITNLTGDVVAMGPGTVSATIQPGVVSYAKIQNVSANSFLGNPTGAPTSVEEISAGTAKAMLGLAAIATSGSAADLTSGTLPAGRFPALTGDVTTTAGSLATTLANTAVTPGSYTSSDITVDSKGRITSIASGGTGFPGYGGAPPRVATASAAGAAGTASRSDHTHGQDLSVVYAPSLAAGQHTGVFQQTYAAPNATPSILTMAAGQVPFGAGSGLLTQSSNLRFSNVATNICLTVFGDSTALSGNVATDGPIVGGMSWAQYSMRAAGTDVAWMAGSNQIGSGGGNVMYFTVVASASPTKDEMIWRSSTAPNGANLTLFPTDGDFGFINAAGLPGGSVIGFFYSPTVLGPPGPGVPTHQGSFIQTAATVEDSNDYRHYAYFRQTTNAWRFMEYNNYASLPTRVPFGDMALATQTNSASLTFGSAVTQNRFVIGDPANAGGGGGLQVISNVLGAGGIPNGGVGQAVAIYASDTFGTGTASVAADDGYFGQFVMGWTNGALASLDIGVGAGQMLSFTYNNPVGATGGASSMTIDGTTGAISMLKATTHTAAFTVTSAATSINGSTFASSTSGGLQVDASANVFAGVASLAAAATAGFPYMPRLAARPTGAPNAFAGAVAFAVDIDTGGAHALYVHNPVGGQWEPIPMFISSATAGAQTAVLTNLPTAVASTTAKYWTFKDSTGVQTYIPFFQ